MASGLGGFTLSPPTFADSNHSVLALVVHPSHVSYKVVTNTRSILEVRKTGRGRRRTYKKRRGRGGKGGGGGGEGEGVEEGRDLKMCPNHTAKSVWCWELNLSTF